MGQELSVDSCCFGRETSMGKDHATTRVERDWEDEALESWENLDPITYFQYAEHRTQNEEERHHAMRKRYKQTQQHYHNQRNAKTYLQEVDEAFDELLGFSEDEPVIHVHSVEMTKMTALQASLKQRERPEGTYSTTALRRPYEYNCELGTVDQVVSPTKEQRQEARTQLQKEQPQAAQAPQHKKNEHTGAAEERSASASASHGRNAKGTTVPVSETVTATASPPQPTTRQPFIEDAQCDHMLQLERDHSGWTATAKEMTRQQLRLWQKKNIGWPPYKARTYKAVHIVKGPIACVWKAWNDVTLRKSYDESYQLAKVLKTIDDSCDGKEHACLGSFSTGRPRDVTTTDLCVVLPFFFFFFDRFCFWGRVFLFPVRLQVLYTAFADSSFARIDFVDHRRWWTVKSRLSALSDPPKGLEFSPASKTARVVVFNTAGKQYDHLAPKNGCTRGRTCQPTGMVFREFVSSGNTRPTIAAWLLLLRPACTWYLCYNTCGATFILTGPPFIFFT